MSDRPETVTAELLAKGTGSDNGCSSSFAVSEQRRVLRRAPRAGLHGGRRIRHATVDRFWARVQRHESGCWLMSGIECRRNGHMQFADETGQRWLAHRWAYQHFIGPIPDGLIVRHRCDVSRCVNPEHLVLGTQKDNVYDAIARGQRNAFGRQRLTVESASEILQAFREGASQKSLAARFGVSKGCIHAVVRGKTWAHLNHPQEPAPAGAVCATQRVCGGTNAADAGHSAD